MATDTTKVKAKLENLSSSLDDLETVLEPLFSQSLPETIVGLEPLQQAKLQTVLPYAVYDLIFIYLKLKGIDPKTHPVIPELDRIRQYFEKISNTENPPAKRTEIDKEAAGRFIKHAISQVKWTKTAAEEAQEENSEEPANSSSSRLPAKVTNKMLQRETYEKELREEEEEDEDEVLEVFEEDALQGDAMDVDKEAEKVEEPTGDRQSSNSNKRRRPAVDPFAGYGEDHTPSTSAVTKNTQLESTQLPTSSSTPLLCEAPKSLKKKKKKGESSSDTLSPAVMDGLTDSSKSSIKKKKKDKGKM